MPCFTFLASSFLLFDSLNAVLRMHNRPSFFATVLLGFGSRANDQKQLTAVLENEQSTEAGEENDDNKKDNKEDEKEIVLGNDQW